MTRGVGYVVGAVADFLLPRHCAVCGRRLLVGEKYLCTFCNEDIPLSYSWERKYHDSADRLNAIIQEGITEYEPYSYVASLFVYDQGNGYRHICHRLKYSGDTGLGRHFSRMLAQKLARSPLFEDVDTVVPVPLHWTRKWTRGYNQAEVIGKEVASVLGASFCPGLIVRKKKTSTQTTLDPEQKRINVEGAFSLSPKATALRSLAPGDIRHILIVDDVFTSGATTAACHRVLRQGFPPPVRISVATLAAVEEA